MSASSGGSTFVWQDTGAVIAGPMDYNSKTATSFTVTVTLPIGHRLAIKADGANLTSTLPACAGSFNCVYQNTGPTTAPATYTITVQGAVGDIVLTAISNYNKINRNFKTYSITVPDMNPDRWNADSSQLDKYSGSPSWTGDAVKVGKLSLTWLDTQVGIEFRNLVADPECRSLGTNELASNSCGLHVHGGLCAVVGGHWFKTGSDPWTAVSYNRTQDGYLRVDTGYTWAESHKASSVVVHNRAGTRMACIDIDRTFIVDLPQGFPSESGFGNAVIPHGKMLSVASLRVSFDGPDTTISFVDLDVSFVDAAEQCTVSDGYDTLTPNSCGIHILAGNTCDSVPGGHFYKTLSDPWTNVVYATADTTRKATGSVTVNTGYSWAETMGRVVVIHGRSGAPLACAVIAGASSDFTFRKFGPLSLVSDTIFPIQASELSLTPKKISADDAVTFSWRNFLGDPACTNTVTDLTCAIFVLDRKVTTATSCSAVIASEMVLGTKLVNYNSDPVAPLSGSIDVTFPTTSRGSHIIDSNFLVVTASDGSIMSCDVINRRPAVATFVTQTTSDQGVYPASSTALRTTFNKLDVTFYQGWVQLAYEGLKADPACWGGADLATSNSCGLHLHAGFSCDSHASVGGHLYDSAAQSPDPWLAAYYRPGNGAVYVDWTFDPLTKDLPGQTVVIHDRTGARIWCGLLAPKLGSTYNTRVTVQGVAAYPPVDSANPIVASLTAFLDFTTDMEAVMITYNNLDADADCATLGATSASNSCGLHLHAGDCPAQYVPDPLTPAAGGHWYDTTVPNPKDNWVKAYAGRVFGQLTVSFAGKPISNWDGRASLLVHSRTGVRLGCAPLRWCNSNQYVNNFACQQCTHDATLATASLAQVATVKTSQCSKILDYCAAPAAPANGALLGCGPTALAGTCRYTCSTGYNPVGDIQMCSGTQLTPNPYCSVMLCGYGDLVAGTWTKAFGTVPALWCGPNICTCSNGVPTTAAGVGGAKCEVNSAADCSSCDAGYQLDVAAAAGTLSQCNQIPDYCTTPTSAASTVTCTGGLLGGTCPATCNAGYSVSAGVYTNDRTCEADTQSAGSWSADTCELISNYCTAPTPSAASTVTCTGGLLGGTCPATCNAGYRVSAGVYTNDRTCEAGTQSAGSWSADTCALISNYCAAPASSAPSTVTVTCTGSRRLGDTCTATCTAGFVLKKDESLSSQTLSCMAGVAPAAGTWTPWDVCVAKTALSPASVAAVSTATLLVATALWLA